MTRWRRTAALLLVPSVAVALIIAAGLSKPAAPPEPPPPFTFADDRVTLAAGSRMLGRLEIVAIGAAARESTEFRTVGQILALSNTSGNLVGNPTAWVELDPRLTKSVGLDLADARAGAAGTAYGLTALAEEYAPRVQTGQAVEIMRYGLRKPGSAGVIVKILPGKTSDQVDVVFRLTRAQDWFPGTNCEVVFPVLRGHPVRVPTTAPVHVGTREYVWKVVGPGQFAAQSVSLVDATADFVSVLGLVPGDRIVARGAILLKPLLKPLLARKKG